MKFLRFLRGVVKFLTVAVILGIIGYTGWKFIDYKWIHPEAYATQSAPWHSALILPWIIAGLSIIVLTILNFLLRYRIKEMNGGTYPNRPRGRNMENVLWHDRKRNGLGLPWSFTKYSVDEDRLFIQTGLFNTKEDEIRLYRVTDLTLKRSFWQKIIGTGHIHCDASDATMPHFDLKNIKNAKKVKDMLSDLVNRSRIKNRVYTTEAVGNRPHSPNENHMPDGNHMHDGGQMMDGGFNPEMVEINPTDANGDGIPDMFER